MMNHVGGFHDWYLISMESISNPYSCEDKAKLTLRFQSQAAFDVLMEFEGGIYLNFGFYDANLIYLSSVIIDGEYIYWVEGEEDLKLTDLKEGNYNYIHGNKLRWKFVLKDEDDW